MKMLWYVFTVWRIERDSETFPTAASHLRMYDKLVEELGQKGLTIRPFDIQCTMISVPFFTWEIQYGIISVPVFTWEIQG